MNEQIEIRDSRNGEWHWVYDAVVADPHLAFADKTIYAALSTFGGYKVIRPSIGEVAKRANASERQTYDSLKILESVGYLKIEKGGGRHKCNIYQLLKRPKGCIKCRVSLNPAQNAGNPAQNAPQLDIHKDRLRHPDSAKKPNTADIPDSDITYSPLEEEKPPATGKAKEAKGLCSWYDQNARALCGGDPRVSYMAKGYFIIVKLLKKYTLEELKAVLSWYLETDKFNKYPQISAALSNDTLRLYFKDNDKSDLIYDKPHR